MPCFFFSFSCSFGLWDREAEGLKVEEGVWGKSSGGSLCPCLCAMPGSIYAVAIKILLLGVT